MADLSKSERLEVEIERIGETELSRSEIDRLLAEGAGRLGLQRLVLDEDGIAMLRFGDGMGLILAHQPGFPGIIAAVPLPEDSPLRPQLLRRLLAANLSAEATRGGAFSLMPPNDTLVLSMRIDLSHRDAARFADELGGFADLAEDWCTEIELFLDILDPNDVAPSEPSEGLDPNTAPLRV